MSQDASSRRPPDQTLSHRPRAPLSVPFLFGKQEFVMDHLSVYEMEQIRAIAAWKSEQPSVLGSLVGGMFGPVKPWVARTVPPSVIEQAVTELTTVGAIEEGRA